MGNGWNRHFVAVTPGAAGIIGLPHMLHNNFKTFDVLGPKTYHRLLTVKRYVTRTVAVEAQRLHVCAAAVR
jgi:hypothetical protein